MADAGVSCANVSTSLCDTTKPKKRQRNEKEWKKIKIKNYVIVGKNMLRPPGKLSQAKA